MKDRIAFIAVGQAGGNIGSLFERKGFKVLYINTSKEDLDITNGKHKYHIQGGDGCNKDRNKAKQLIINDFENIYNEIKSKIDAELIYVIFASGGGTGSGSSPMLAELMLQEGSAVGMICVIPDENESIKTHINCYECFTEINDIEGLSSCFFLDNKNKNKMAINGIFVDMFMSFISIPDKYKSVKGNVDKAEIMETLKANGTSLIVSSDESSEFIGKFKNNIFAPMQDDKKVKYITASLTKDIEVSDIEKTVGVPFDVFKTYNKDKNICCVSGMSFPEGRLESVLEKINKNKEIIEKSISSSKISNMKKNLDFLSEINSKYKRESQQKLSSAKKTTSREDIMSKYLK